ncbi:hypothetical protein [Actinoalloteichus hymeniacidonis]|uniref:Uncharacterized protein n=1 Tax=Actinoalloteichus hymeniacidonis TaxID=340345 RepID=A0AAC9HLU1_9PSEU|nr:hypothetical protein [Actinoalloteichus hymeniacidonis]AOS61722.1 hypothetical protein TL08_04460 [Actinoalloteichus hymeniacidonis]MBB5910260.1 uncharacterized membrane protein YjjP (DUF1212 family) [Actinoalloteichus hymeniacidonis]
MLRWTDRAVLVVLILDAVLIALLGMFFLPLYVGTVPVPVSALVAGIANLWLVREAARLSTRVAVVAAPLAAWLTVVVLFAFIRPGGDVVLLDDWRSLLLLAVGSLPAAMAVGTVLARGQAATT